MPSFIFLVGEVDFFLVWLDARTGDLDEGGLLLGELVGLDPAGRDLEEARRCVLRLRRFCDSAGTLFTLSAAFPDEDLDLEDLRALPLWLFERLLLDLDFGMATEADTELMLPVVSWISKLTYDSLLELSSC